MSKLVVLNAGVARGQAVFHTAELIEVDDVSAAALRCECSRLSLENNLVDNVPIIDSHDVLIGSSEYHAFIDESGVFLLET